MNNISMALGITGSFCTFDKIIVEIINLKSQGANIYPIFSFNVSEMDTRFNKAEEFRKTISEITEKTVIDTIQKAEPLGPSGIIDVMVIAPCTGNTLAKLANAITDTPVLMAAKAHLRNNKPLVIAISTNDGLSNNARNLGYLLNMKNVYFVPYCQDDSIKKPNSLVAKMDMIGITVESALKGVQIQPVLV